MSLFWKYEYSLTIHYTVGSWIAHHCYSHPDVQWRVRAMPLYQEFCRFAPIFLGRTYPLTSPYPVPTFNYEPTVWAVQAANLALGLYGPSGSMCFVFSFWLNNIRKTWWDRKIIVLHFHFDWIIYEKHGEIERSLCCIFILIESYIKSMVR